MEQSVVKELVDEAKRLRKVAEKHDEQAKTARAYATFLEESAREVK